MEKGKENCSPAAWKQNLLPSTTTSTTQLSTPAPTKPTAAVPKTTPSTSTTTTNPLTASTAAPLTPPRPRRERPCDGCRRRKSKCVLQPLPPSQGPPNSTSTTPPARRCVLCDFHKQDCTFVENALPRKRKAVDPPAAGQQQQQQQQQQASPPGSSGASSVSAVDASPKRRALLNSGVTGTGTGARRGPVGLPPTVNVGGKAGSQQQQQQLKSTGGAATISNQYPPLSTQPHHHVRYLGQTTALDASLLALNISAGTPQQQQKQQQFQQQQQQYSPHRDLLTAHLRRVHGNEFFMTHADAEVRLPGNSRYSMEAAAAAAQDEEARARAEIERTVGPFVGPRLLRLYFRIVHPSYPIVSQREFLRGMAAMHAAPSTAASSRRQSAEGGATEQQQQDAPTPPAPSLLAAVYLLALAWWEQDPVLVAHNHHYARPDAARLEYLAITSLTQAMQRPKLAAVQAGLLLLQRASSSPTTTSSAAGSGVRSTASPGSSNTWTLTVQLVALAQDLGLHLDCSEWAVPETEKRLRKRIAWALYLQDKWSAVVHGRPSHIGKADWCVPMVTEGDFEEDGEDEEPGLWSDEDDLLAPMPPHVDEGVEFGFGGRSSRQVGADSGEETSPLPTPGAESRRPSASTAAAAAATTAHHHGRVCFMQMISLTAILAEVCETFYSESAKAEFARAAAGSSAGPMGATQLVLNRAKPVQIKLKDWFARLPAECKMDASEEVGFCGQAYLHLAYFATEISIHRRIVQSLAESSGTAGSQQTILPPPSQQAAAAAESTDAPTTTALAPPTAPPYLLFICRSAAKTRLISALDFVNRLRPAHLQAFWFFAAPFGFSLIGTFGALLQATSPAREEAEFYRCRLAEFRWSLAVSAKRAMWISSAAESVAESVRLVEGVTEGKPWVGEVEGFDSAVSFPRTQMASVTVMRRPQGLGMLDGEEDEEMEEEDEEGDEEEGEEWS